MRVCNGLLLPEIFWRRLDKVERLQALQSKFGHTSKGLMTARISNSSATYNRATCKSPSLLSCQYARFGLTYCTSLYF